MGMTKLQIEKILERGLEGIQAAIAGSHGNTSAAGLDAAFAGMVTGENTTKLFRLWWDLAREQDSASEDTATKNRYHTLSRWFDLLGKAWAGKYYTLRGPDYRVNTTGQTALTPMGDLAGRAAAACATESTGAETDWADEDPMTWYLRFNGLSLADGTMDILAVEGVDDEFDISGNLAPVYTGRLGLFKLHFSDGAYEYKTFATQPEGGFSPWAGDVAPDGSHRSMNWEATFGGSKTSGGKLTSGSGFKGGTWERNDNTPATSMSANAGLTAARLWGANEGIYSDTDLEPILDLFQIRHQNLENSGIIEGCLNYYLDYVVAQAETGAKSVILTAAQAANLVIGSRIDIGTSARGSQIGQGNIVSIESVTISGTEYARVNLDLPAAVDVPEGAHACTLPWTPGSTERLPGRKDGSLYSCTNGKTPARIAGVEIIDGAYAVGMDPLWNSDWNADRTPKGIMTIYQCRNGAKQAGSLTADYTEVGSFTTDASGWQYEKHLAINSKGLIYPDALGGSTTTYMKSAYCFYASSGVRAPWRFCGLDNGGFGGLAGAFGNGAPGYASWVGRPRLSGSGKTRGEWAA